MPCNPSFFLPPYDVEPQSIVILDFGAQYSQLIARRIREQNVFSVVLPCNASLEEIRAYKPVGIVLSGGPSSVYDADAPPADERVFSLALPVLGICYGLQFMAHKLGGKVRPATKREYGHAEVRIEDQDGSRLFQGLPTTLNVWMSHGDEAVELPQGFRCAARTAGSSRWRRWRSPRTTRPLPLSGAPIPAGYESYEDLLSSATGDFRYPEIDEYDAAGMCYTSGTTGRPQGVVHSHRSTVLHALSISLPDWALHHAAAQRGLGGDRGHTTTTSGRRWPQGGRGRREVPARCRRRGERR